MCRCHVSLPRVSVPHIVRLRLLLVAAIASITVWTPSGRALGGVIVICNRTPHMIVFDVAGADGRARRLSLTPNNVIPIAVDAELQIAFSQTPRTPTPRSPTPRSPAPRTPPPGAAQPPPAPPTITRRALQANSIHYFLVRNLKLELYRLELPSAPGGDEPPPTPKSTHPAALVVIPVMLLVDDDEPAVRRIWEKALRERMTQASAIFERHCGVRFEVTAIGTWTSNDAVNDFERSLREFEMKVNPAPARLAIGFTSQYTIPRGRMHLGGTRGALNSHILIREWSQHVSTTERLEILVHELGHFLGAAHSPEADSVMRPTLGDRRSHARSFRIGFDALNTLIMYLVAEELRTRPIRSLGHVHRARKAHLRRVYSAMVDTVEDDESAENFIEQLDRSPYVRPAPTRHASSLVEATRTVVRAVDAAVAANRARAPGTGGPFTGDRLTEFYVRHAAAAAARLPRDRAAKAFVLGLGIAMDRTTTLRYAPALANLCREVESTQQRYQRLSTMGTPTVGGRADLAQHFFIASVLAVAVNLPTAEGAAVAKELADARGSSGFSFIDLSASVAGATFATEVHGGKIPLAHLGASFTLADFVPDHTDLAEGISWEEFTRQYGSTQDDRFHRQYTAIRQRVRALPGYQRQSAAAGRAVTH